jgi:DNA-binding beta-propeller fold protein YncE
MDTDRGDRWVRTAATPIQRRPSRSVHSSRFDALVRALGITASRRSVMAAPNGKTIYVLDAGHHRVQVFDAAGNYLGQWGRQGTGEGQFDGPIDVAVAPDGQTVYVVDQGNNRVQVFCVAPVAEDTRPATSGPYTAFHS